jgi:hypothetical protein
MKAKSNARWITRIGTVVCCLAITAIAGVEFKVSKSLAGQIDQVAADQNDLPQVWYPNASVGDFLAAALR